MENYTFFGGQKMDEQKVFANIAEIRIILIAERKL